MICHNFFGCSSKLLIVCI